MKIPISKVYETLDFFSERLSTQLRTITIGVLSLVWLFLSGAKDAPESIKLSYTPSLYAIACLCLFSLILDYLHYFIGFISSNHVRRLAEKNKETETQYNPKDWRYRLHAMLFWWKLLPALISSIWLITILWFALALTPNQSFNPDVASVGRTSHNHPRIPVSAHRAASATPVNFVR